MQAKKAGDLKNFWAKVGNLMEIYDNEFPAGEHLSTVVHTPFLQPAIDTSGQKNKSTMRNTSAGEGPAYTQAFISLAIDVPTG